MEVKHAFVGVVLSRPFEVLIQCLVELSAIKNSIEKILYVYDRRFKSQSNLLNYMGV